MPGLNLAQSSKNHGKNGEYFVAVELEEGGCIAGMVVVRGSSFQGASGPGDIERIELVILGN